MFNSTYFIENSVIVMDNAKVPLGTPNSIWKKQEVANYSLWSTPYHSDLQLIVIVWANMSREQWAGSTKNTTFNDVKVRLDHAFATLDSKTVTGWMHQESKQDIMIFVGPCNADGGD